MASSLNAILTQNRRQVYVLRLPLEAEDNIISQFERTLAREEAAHAARFRLDYLRRRFIINRASLRIILANYLHTDPSRVQFSYGPNGKPHVDNPAGLQFSTSHSGDLTLLAFALHCRIGVDVECIRSVPDGIDIARRFFHPQEIADLESLTPSDREQAFFLCWTRKEAYVKASGDGLSMPLNRFRVTLQPANVAQPLPFQPITDDATWTMHDLSAPPSYTATVVYEDLPRPVYIASLAAPSCLLDRKGE